MNKHEEDMEKLLQSLYDDNETPVEMQAAYELEELLTPFERLWLYAWKFRN